MNTFTTTPSARHTPGPWHVHEEVRNDTEPITFRTICFASGGHPVQLCLNSIHREAEEAAERKANAYLIAAAPELLEACRFTLDLLDHLPTCDYAKGGDRPAREKLLAAVAKALPPA